MRAFQVFMPEGCKETNQMKFISHGLTWVKELILVLGDIVENKANGG